MPPHNIMTGKDGEIYTDDGTILAQVNTWQAQVEVKKFTGYSVTLTFQTTLA